MTVIKIYVTIYSSYDGRCGRKNNDITREQLLATREIDLKDIRANRTVCFFLLNFETAIFLKKCLQFNKIFPMSNKIFHLFKNYLFIFITNCYPLQTYF